MTKKLREPVDVPVSLLSEDPDKQSGEPTEGTSSTMETAVEGSPDSYILTVELPTIVPRKPESWVRVRYSRSRH